MSREPEVPRRYDDDEVARILKRATEIRRDRSLPAPIGADEGLTLEDLEEIAAEAGIDVAHLRQAAMEVETGTDRPGPMDRFVGGPLTVVYEEVVEGEVGEDGFHSLLQTLQRALGELGVPSLMGRTLTWKNEVAKSGGRSTMATVSVRGGQTTLRIEENYQQVAGGLQGGLTVGGGVGVGVGLGVPLAQAAGSLLLGIAFPIGALFAAYLIARGSYRGYVGKRSQKMAEVLAQMAEVVRAEVRSAESLKSGRTEDRRLTPGDGSGGPEGADAGPAGSQDGGDGSDRPPRDPGAGGPATGGPAGSLL